MSQFKVSVIIPVFNAGEFVTEAVESALAQNETAEVILIEDGSTDDSLQICRDLAQIHGKVRLLQQPDGKNRGPAASRNLGIKNARFDYIAFLDADDFFLIDRFKITRKVFEENPDCGGVYEAIGTVVEDETGRARWLASGEMRQELITITKAIPPTELLERLVLGGAGYFSPDGLVFKKSLLNSAGLMNETLRLHEDNEFFFRLAAVSDLSPGQLSQPVTMRRVHSHNTITTPRSKLQIYEARLKMWKSSYQWFRSRSNREQKKLISKALISYCKSYGFGTESEHNGRKFEVERRVRLLLLLIDFPELLFSKKYWVPFLPLRLQKKLNLK